MHVRRLLWSLGACAALAAQQAPAPRPTLVVLLAVDQLATWVLDEALPHCGEHGFKRMLRQGTAFPNCAYRHACSETGPGHATIGTGADARDHGIVGNEWYDPRSFEKVYCCADPEAQGVGAGTVLPRGPRLLLLPTFGDQLKLHRGKAAQVVSLSWKDRSAIFMAGYAADDVLWFSRENGTLVSSTRYGAELPAWAQQFNAQQPAEAYRGKVWTRCAPDAAYAGLEDDVAFEAMDANGKRTLPAVIDGGPPTASRSVTAYYEQLFASPFANELLLAAAKAALAARQLGADAVLDLLCVSFSSNDVIGHRNGPQSVEARDMTLRTDALLADLFAHLDQVVGKDRWLAILTADHGVAPIPELAARRGVPAGRGLSHAWARDAAERALRAALGEPPAPAKTWVQAADAGGLYLLPHPERERMRRIAAEAARRVRGLAATFTLDELLAAGTTDDPRKRAHVAATHPLRSPDVTLVPQPHWIDGGIPATHGSPYAYDREVPLLLLGPGVPAGRVETLEVTPGAGVLLVARLLGVPMPIAAPALPWPVSDRPR